jgi:hypothetical protein
VPAAGHADGSDSLELIDELVDDEEAMRNSERVMVEL